MSDFYNAFEMSPVPAPGPEAVAPELFRGIYGMPAFATIPTGDLAASVDFWTRGLGFFELFTIPGRLVHLRRWAFQDVLLVAAEDVPASDMPASNVPASDVPARASAISLSFSCVLNQVDALIEACRAIRPDSVEGPRDTPWNTRDVSVTTPENARIVLTAAKPFDPTSEEARNLAAIGITPPSAAPGDGQR
ncbi:VOC family protein [Streptomyces sp. DSM 44915]|uniref:VOC family protein n=1 Tax=Streptomyces chisholmiae TaxID=3075540 RepID=A0ABU2JUN7_9ACTN|nr:VOC family protein [Streptomyces sp. DSM 44915]MDT0267923.1 VOC family protein [Streptomyces sp. DSM 44915]